MTDLEIVCDMVERGLLDENKADVWQYLSGHRQAHGFELNRKYLRGTRTLQMWARQVREKIAERRAHIQSGTVRFGHSIAQGSNVRFAKDGTPIGNIPGSSWNKERLEAAHAGNTRRAAKLPAIPRKKRQA